MPSLWFVMPVHGRIPLAAICVKQLRRTCDALTDHGIEATAVIVADPPNLRSLSRQLESRTMLGFGTIPQNNQFLSRRFNDGIQFACDPKHNPRPADYVVPIGSDDWIDWRILTTLPRRNQVIGFQHLSFVREDGLELTKTRLNYTGGCGMRIYPRSVVAPLGYRPADPDRRRGCDTSILNNLISGNPRLQVVHMETDPLQIVDWKSAEGQLNEYAQIVRRHGRDSVVADPFDELASVFPEEALGEMRSHYGRLVAA